MDWYSNWFNRDYLRLYAHRNRESAAAEVAWVVGQVRTLEGKILDIGCGAGRHLAALQDYAKTVFGADLSLELLNACQPEIRAPHGAVSLICADMRRLPFPDRTFQLVTSFFTSFGYFATDDEHRALLSEWRRVVAGGGTLFLDYLNKELVESTLRPTSERRLDGCVIIEQRYFTSDGLRLVKDIQIDDGTAVRTYQESVRVYSREMLEIMLGEAGFRDLRIFGDFTGQPHSASSKRLLVFASAE
ncbi:MAG: class I SAM-dependent methyltransferase [Bdellovibrionota bacterium]